MHSLTRAWDPRWLVALPAFSVAASGSIGWMLPVILALAGLAFKRTATVSLLILWGVALAFPAQSPLAFGATLALAILTLRPTWTSLIILSSALLIATLITLSLVAPAEIPLRIPSLLIASTALVLSLAWENRTIRRASLARLHRLRRKMRAIRSRTAQMQVYLPPQANRAIKSGKTLSQIKHRRRYLTVFFSDIVRFTDRIEQSELEDAANFLNDYRNQMCQIATRNGGTLDKFIGDSLMITFGDDADSQPDQNSQRALQMALEMQQAITQMASTDLARSGSNHLSVRIGIASGYCTTGNFGSDTRMEYTAIGKAVNLASRLEELANPNEILVSHSVYQASAKAFHFDDQGPTPVKGFASPVSVYRLLGPIGDTNASPVPVARARL